MPESIIAVRRLEYRYPGGGGQAALRSIDLDVYAGEMVLLAGESGGGKSTLLRAMAGLVPHFHGGQLSGTVEVCGLDTHSCGPAEIARTTSTVFADPESQIVMNTVRAELALPLENRGAGATEIARAVEETSIVLGISELLDRSVHTLSGGELQRVALGAALVTRPQLLLLDEPTSQLDPIAGDELISRLRRLNEEWGTTVLIAEQRLGRCLAAADRVLVLGRGSLSFDGSVDGFLEWASREAPALMTPAAQMFVGAGLRPLPASPKDARRQLAARGIEQAASSPDAQSRGPWIKWRRGRRADVGAALRAKSLWIEYDDGSGAGRAALRGLELRLARGSVTALAGRNGAGKSTLLNAAAGLIEPTRGSLDVEGSVSLVLQNPNDYLLRERVRDELPPSCAESALAEVGLESVAQRDPRDLSGGERQRLALAIVLAGRGIGGGDPPDLVALDEPTRGLDRAWKGRLGIRLREFAAGGSTVVVATHDVEFIAQIADRCVLLGQGEVVADGSATDVLSGGQYFVTEVARVLGAGARCLTPEQGARWLEPRLLDQGSKALRHEQVIS
ncbi:MAG: ATP-binding cassette domain-containing protein [Phycisphaeraceae bacterium]